MRIGVFSDTHGLLHNMQRALKALGPLDAIIHLGDYCGDAKRMEEATGLPVQTVSGNCDFSSFVAVEAVYEPLSGVRLLLAHGHLFGVKQGLQRLCYRAQELNCAAALFGHTHASQMERQGSVLLLNPGSLSQPRLCLPPSCACLHINEDGRLNASIITLA